MILRRERGERSELRHAAMLRGLAARLRSGLTFSAALADLGDEDAVIESPAVQRAIRAVRLGLPSEVAARELAQTLGPHGADLVVALELQRRAGGDLAALLDDCASQLETEARLRSFTGAQVAGMRLSARMIALLPVVPLAGHLTKDGLPSGPAALFAVVGLCLGTLGFWWMGRVLPRTGSGTSEERPVAAILARCVARGAPVPLALREIAIALDTPGLRAARRRAALGMAWADALGDSGDAELARIGGIIRRAETLGVAPASALLHLDAQRRAAGERAHEAAARRAPVRMTLPLTLCVLPSFVLLGLVPLLSG